MINKKIRNVLILITLLFTSLIVYLTYFEIVQKDKVADNQFNRRKWAQEADVERGSVFDATGVELAYSEDGKRIYPYKSLYSHVIGYSSDIYGKSMLEKSYNDYLLGKNSITEVFGISTVKRGYDVELTIDHELQKTASNLMRGRNGAAVAIDVKNGAVLAMVSNPGFDPNDALLTKNWQDLTTDADSPLLPRATNGLYAPGSTFKIITSSAAIENGTDTERIYEDTGIFTVGGKKFKNYKSKTNGNITLSEGFAKSSNFVFCNLGAELGTKKLLEFAEKFGFNKKIDFDVYLEKSIFPDKNGVDADNANLGIGQGEILATPLQMAMVTAGIANGGTVMKPYLVDRVVNSAGLSVYSASPKALYKAVEAGTAEEIKEMMRKTVKTGTGTVANVWDIEICGKTGTAENERSLKEKDTEHTWFVAFAPKENPEIAVAVIMEYSGGSGSANCGPVARDIICKYLR